MTSGGFFHDVTSSQQEFAAALYRAAQIHMNTAFRRAQPIRAALHT